MFCLFRSLHLLALNFGVWCVSDFLVFVLFTVAAAALYAPRRTTSTTSKKNIIISKSNRTEWNRVMKYISYVVCLHFTPMRSNRIVIVDSHSQPFQWCFTSRTPFVCVCVCSIWQNTGFCWTFTESDLVARKYRYGKRQNTLNECPCHWSWYIYMYISPIRISIWLTWLKCFFLFFFWGSLSFEFWFFVCAIKVFSLYCSHSNKKDRNFALLIFDF